MFLSSAQPGEQLLTSDTAWCRGGPGCGKQPLLCYPQCSSICSCVYEAHPTDFCPETKEVRGGGSQSEQIEIAPIINFLIVWGTDPWKAWRLLVICWSKPLETTLVGVHLRWSWDKLSFVQENKQGYHHSSDLKWGELILTSITYVQTRGWHCHLVLFWVFSLTHSCPQDCLRSRNCWLCLGVTEAHPDTR